MLVSGAPGTGKSTVAMKLGRALGFPLLSKDLIKESLWDALEPPSGDLEWSRRVGGAAMEMLWTLAAHSPQVVLEANFRPHSEYEREKLKSLSGRLVEVYCWCPPEVATQRYETRAATPAHHPAHVTPKLDPKYLEEFDQPMGLGPLIRVDTTLPTDIRGIADEVSAALKKPDDPEETVRDGTP